MDFQGLKKDFFFNNYNNELNIFANKVQWTLKNNTKKKINYIKFLKEHYTFFSTGTLFLHVQNYYYSH